MDVTSILKPFWLPELASEHGAQVDHMNGFVHWFMAVLFVGWSIFLIYTFWRFNQKRNPKADYHGVRGHTTTHIEIGVCIVEAVLLVGFAFPLWSRQADEYPTGPDVVKMRAVGEQFLWNFHYAGNDGVLGRVDPRLIGAGNPIGRDLNDPNGKDDFLVAATMKLPNNRPVIVDVGSKDVIHNLALTPMRAAQDATPGIKSHMWFKPIKEGSWDIICGQLCGAGHSQMKATLEVVSQGDFDKWFKAQSDNALKAATAPAPATAAAH
jgi:cytochrome c oxidase subunit II